MKSIHISLCFENCPKDLLKDSCEGNSRTFPSICFSAGRCFDDSTSAKVYSSISTFETEPDEL